MPHPHLPLCFNFTLYVCMRFLTSMCQRCWCSPTRHTTSDNRQSTLAAYPLIASLLARIAVLPASSAEVERVFSAVKRIKTPMRNQLCTRILDFLVRVTMDGPNTPSWDPMPAALKWESTGVLSCCGPHLHQRLIHLQTEYYHNYVLHVTRCWYCSSCTLR